MEVLADIIEKLTFSSGTFADGMYDGKMYIWTFVVMCIMTPFVNLFYYKLVDDPRLATGFWWFVFWLVAYFTCFAILAYFVNVKLTELYPGVELMGEMFLYLGILGVYSFLTYFLTAIGIKRGSINCNNVPF